MQSLPSPHILEAVSSVSPDERTAERGNGPAQESGQLVFSSTGHLPSPEPQFTHEGGEGGVLRDHLKLHSRALWRGLDVPVLPPCAVGFTLVVQDIPSRPPASSADRIVR